MKLAKAISSLSSSFTFDHLVSIKFSLFKDQLFVRKTQYQSVLFTSSSFSFNYCYYFWLSFWQLIFRLLNFFNGVYEILCAFIALLQDQTVLIWFPSSNLIKDKMQNKQNFFCGFKPDKMHCEFMYTTNAFQDESWDLSYFISYEGSRMKYS